MPFSIFSVLVSFQTVSFSARNLEYFLVHSLLPLDTERADFAMRLESNLVSLETDIDFTYSAMYMINEEQVTLLLHFQSTCPSLIQESDKENCNFLLLVIMNSTRQFWIAKKLYVVPVLLRNDILYVDFLRNRKPSKMSGTMEQVLNSLTMEMRR